MFNITEAPGAMGSSDPPLLERFSGVVRTCKDGTEIGISGGIGFELFKGDVGVIGVDVVFVAGDCLAAFDPKFQNE
jgi:hypothetical protein